MRWARSSSDVPSLTAVWLTLDVPSDALVVARPWAMPPATIERIRIPTSISIQEKPACRALVREVTRLFLAFRALTPIPSSRSRADSKGKAGPLSAAGPSGLMVRAP